MAKIRDFLEKASRGFVCNMDDGYAHIWSTDDQVKLHKGPIFVYKLVKIGNYMLFAGIGTTPIVWEDVKGQCKNS